MAAFVPAADVPQKPSQKSPAVLIPGQPAVVGDGRFAPSALCAGPVLHYATTKKDQGLLIPGHYLCLYLGAGKTFVNAAITQCTLKFVF